MALVALLRGINVGGRRKVSMPDLAAAFVSAGCIDVVTYIQSGNVVFDPPTTFDKGGSDRASVGELTARLEQVIREMGGFDVPVVLRTGAELAALLTGQPFPDADENHLHVCFLAAEPQAAALARFAEAAEPPEAFAHPDVAHLRQAHSDAAQRGARDIYLYLPAGMGRSKLGLAIDRLKVPVTVRNWRTVNKLAQLAGAPPLKPRAPANPTDQ